MDRQSVLQLVKNAVYQVDNKADIILFGSRARGDYNEESDWDFLILTEKKENFKLKEELWEKMYFAELESGEIFGTIVHNKTNWENYEVTPLYKFIKKEGILI